MAEKYEKVKFKQMITAMRLAQADQNSFKKAMKELDKTVG